MKLKSLLVIAISFSFSVFAQEHLKENLGDFVMSNPSSPAFLLVGDSPTTIYTPNNIKALALHISNNFGENLSIEFAPYFFINEKSKNRTYYKYVGLEKDKTTNQIKQNPFSGLNTTTISFAYLDKQFSGFDGKRKTYSIGMRTTIIRFFDKETKYSNAEKLGVALSNIDNPPLKLLIGAKNEDPIIKAAYLDSIKSYYQSEKKKLKPYIDDFKKNIKPIFSVDGAIAYSSLFKENEVNSGTVNRLGTWLTAQGSLILNKDADSKYNNYLNLLMTGRYIEDEFNVTEEGVFVTNYYRDLGGKLEFELGKLAFAYEFISRNGAINSERSVGTIRYTFNKNLTLSGGFGKDFPVEDNLVTVFGINWGINLGNGSVSLLDK